MSNIALWLLTVEIIGLAAFPLAFFLFPKMADRGYGFSKTFGILLVGYASWILSALRILPSERLTLAGVVVALGAAAGALAWRNRRLFAEFVARNWKMLALGEAVFLAFLLAWTLFRAYDPAIDHTEQPMDFMLLNASIQTSLGQPEDAWLRGETVSYYYFGYWMMGALSELSGVASNFSYNLAMALIPALAAVGALSLVSGMARAGGGSLRFALLGGVGAGVVLGVVANLEGVLEFMRANGMGSADFWAWVGIDGLREPAPALAQGWLPEEFWWWFRASRVINTFVDGAGIDYTIAEFPFFSFILGDMHPHVTAIPFALLFAAFALSYFRSEESADLMAMSVRGYAFLLAMAAALGGLAFTNMWELPTYSALLIGVAALKAYPNPDGADALESAGATLARVGRAAAQAPVVVIALAVALYLPYYLAFSASVNGIGATLTPTRYLHLFIVWAPVLAFVAPFVAVSFWQTTVGADWRRMTVISLLAGFLPFAAWMLFRLESPTPAGSALARFAHTLPLALLVCMAAWSALHEAKRRGASGKAFALALATLGLLLLLGPEFLFVDDVFGAPSHRMNTVFKLHYQAWAILACVSGYAIYCWLAARPALGGWRRALSTLTAVAAVALVAGGMYYTAAAAASKAGGFEREPTLDGLAFVKQSQPAEYAAIQFIRRSLPPDAAVLEAVGEWFDSALISRSTGAPTVLAWPGHQEQWRGGSAAFAERAGDVAAIYTTTNADEAQNLLAKYNVDYVYVGPRERLAYGGAGLDKFPDFMDEIFRQNDSVIYRTR